MIDAKFNQFENTTDINLKLEDDTLELERLKANLNRANELSKKATDILSSFDDRLSKLEGKVLPFHEQTQQYTKLNTNIGTTLNNLNSIIKHLELSSTEEKVILAGPVNGNLKSYLRALKKLEDSNEFLSTTKFSFCKKAQNQLNQVLKVALQHLSKSLKETLLEFSGIVDIDNHNELMPSDESIKDILLISKYLGQIPQYNSKDSIAESYSGTIIKVRSQYLLANLTPYSKASIALSRDLQGGGGSYIKNSSKFITYCRAFITLSQAEIEFIERAIIPREIQPTLHQIIGPSYKQLTDTGDQLIMYAKKDLHNEIFLLFNALECLLENSKPIGFILTRSELSKAPLDKLITSINSLVLRAFPAFLDDIRTSTSAQKSAQLANDGNVNEMTSGALNFIKRLLEYPQTVGLTLNNLGAGHGCFHSDTIPSDATLPVRYFSNVIESLIQYNEVKSRLFKKSTLQVIFQLNNIYHIYKALQHPWLSSHVHQSVIERIGKLIKKLQNLYHDSWKVCLEYLTDTGLTRVTTNGKSNLSSSDKSNIKECFKNFNSEFEEQIQIQKTYTISDGELRHQLINQVQKILIPLYSRNMERFKNSDFSKTPSKYIKYDANLLTTKLNELFDQSS